MSTIMLHRFDTETDQIQHDEPEVSMTAPEPTPYATMPTQMLRRTGRRPFRFNGREICTAIGYQLGSRLWYELNLWRTDEARFVVDIRMFTKDEAAKDHFFVQQADSFEEAVAMLEAYDPAHDVIADLPLDDEGVSSAELSLNGAVLRQRIDEARRQYETVLGDVLYELNVA